MSRDVVQVRHLHPRRAPRRRGEGLARSGVGARRRASRAHPSRPHSPTPQLRNPRSATKCDHLPDRKVSARLVALRIVNEGCGDKQRMRLYGRGVSSGGPTQKQLLSSDGHRERCKAQPRSSVSNRPSMNHDVRAPAVLGRLRTTRRFVGSELQLSFNRVRCWVTSSRRAAQRSDAVPNL